VVQTYVETNSTIQYNKWLDIMRWIFNNFIIFFIKDIFIFEIVIVILSIVSTHQYKLYNNDTLLDTQTVSETKPKTKFKRNILVYNVWLYNSFFFVNIDKFLVNI